MDVLITITQVWSVIFKKIWTCVIWPKMKFWPQKIVQNWNSSYKKCPKYIFLYFGYVEIYQKSNSCIQKLVKIIILTKLEFEIFKSVLLYFCPFKLKTRPLCNVLTFNSRLFIRLWEMRQASHQNKCGLKQYCRVCKIHNFQSFLHS